MYNPVPGNMENTKREAAWPLTLRTHSPGQRHFKMKYYLAKGNEGMILNDKTR